MLEKLFLYLETKTASVKQTLETNNPDRLGFFLATWLLFLELSLSFAQYLLILFRSSSQSFKVLIRQPNLQVCLHSYTNHKQFQKKVRIFSTAGFFALILATVITSLAINFLTGPVFQTRAAANITSEYKYAWSENGGWFNFGSDGGGVTVADSALTGYVWSENMGWISLNCSNDSSCAASDYKIANDGEGNLSGYAWGENIGWVNFAPANGGVSIDSEGVFSGYAWSENTGWIVFNCQDVDACLTSDFKVKTTWLPESAEDQDDDSEGVEVSGVRYSSTDTAIVINWETNHNADSRVHWGKDKNLEKEKNENKKEKKHRVVLRDLEPNTEYYFRVKSTDGDDNSDSSRVYSVSTKAASSLFAKREYSAPDENLTVEENLEKVDIEVQDKGKNEEDREAVKKVEESLPEDAAENNQLSQNENFIAESFSFIGGNIGDAASKTWNGITYAYNGTYDFIMSGQRKVSNFFKVSGREIAGVYDELIAKLSKKKAIEIAEKKQKRFFTAFVSIRNEKKMLSEVRFQILDKKDEPIADLETALFSDPRISRTDEDGIASFKDVPIGSHTLAFDYQGENFQKKVAIADTLTDEGKVRAEVVQVKAEKERVALWMWGIIALLVISVSAAAYFARKYYALKRQSAS